MHIRPNALASASETSSSSACVRRLSQRQRRRDGSSACARRLVQRQRRRDGRRRCRSWRRSWRQGRSRSRRRRDGSSACVRRLGRRRGAAAGVAAGLMAVAGAGATAAARASAGSASLRAPHGGGAQRVLLAMRLEIRRPRQRREAALANAGSIPAENGAAGMHGAEHAAPSALRASASRQTFSARRAVAKMVHRIFTKRVSAGHRAGGVCRPLPRPATRQSKPTIPLDHPALEHARRCAASRGRARSSSPARRSRPPAGSGAGGIGVVAGAAPLVTAGASCRAIRAEPRRHGGVAVCGRVMFGPG